MDRSTLEAVAQGLPVTKQEVTTGFIGGEGI
jgi:hypothetical protein